MLKWASLARSTPTTEATPPVSLLYRTLWEGLGRQSLIEPAFQHALTKIGLAGCSSYRFTKLGFIVLMFMRTASGSQVPAPILKGLLLGLLQTIDHRLHDSLGQGALVRHHPFDLGGASGRQRGCVKCGGLVELIRKQSYKGPIEHAPLCSQRGYAHVHISAHNTSATKRQRVQPT